MRGLGVNGEGELRGQPANPGSPGKMAIKTECVCVCVLSHNGRRLAVVSHFTENIGNCLFLQSGCIHGGRVCNYDTRCTTASRGPVHQM